MSIADEHGPDAPDGNIISAREQMLLRRRDRKYLPTAAELIDRLTIVMLKSIHIPENRKQYLIERDLILHDIGVAFQESNGRYYDPADLVMAVAVIMLANNTIWTNESAARQGCENQNELLFFTHSLNGLRATAKNRISELVGGRRDLKVDALAASLDSSLGNWNVFEVP